MSVAVSFSDPSLASTIAESVHLRRSLRSTAPCLLAGVCNVGEDPLASLYPEPHLLDGAAVGL